MYSFLYHVTEIYFSNPSSGPVQRLSPENRNFHNLASILTMSHITPEDCFDYTEMERKFTLKVAALRKGR